MKLKVADVPASIRELDQTRSNFQRPIVARFALTVAGRFKSRTPSYGAGSACVPLLQRLGLAASSNLWQALVTLRSRPYGPTKKAPPKRGLEVGGPRSAHRRSAFESVPHAPADNNQKLKSWRR